MNSEHSNKTATHGLSQETNQTFSRVCNLMDQLINQVRQDVGQVSEPKAQALLETTAEVLLGLKRAYGDYAEGHEKAWQ